jgi:hypothetical protein
MRSMNTRAMAIYATTQTGRGFGYGLHEAMDQIGAVLGPVLLSLVLYNTRARPADFELPDKRPRLAARGCSRA